MLTASMKISPAYFLRRSHGTRRARMFAGAFPLGLEGIVAKVAASPYIGGPRETSHWLKDENCERQEKIEFILGSSTLVLPFVQKRKEPKQHLSLSWLRLSNLTNLCELALASFQPASP